MVDAVGCVVEASVLEDQLSADHTMTALALFELLIGVQIDNSISQTS
jgi:hypothetical protein